MIDDARHWSTDWDRRAQAVRGELEAIQRDIQNLQQERITRRRMLIATGDDMETSTNAVQPSREWVKFLGEIISRLLFLTFIMLTTVAVWRSDWPVATFYLLVAWCFAWLEKNRWPKRPGA